MRTALTTPNERRDAWTVAHPVGSDTVKRLCLDAQAGIDALTTIALAAGLGADATAEEVAARVRSMLAVVTYQLERDCSYGDGCPNGERHGRCDPCQARKVMGLPASVEGMYEDVLTAALCSISPKAAEADQACEVRVGYPTRIVPAPSEIFGTCTDPRRSGRPWCAQEPALARRRRERDERLEAGRG